MPSRFRLSRLTASHQRRPTKEEIAIGRRKRAQKIHSYSRISKFSGFSHMWELRIDRQDRHPRPRSASEIETVEAPLPGRWAGSIGPGELSCSTLRQTSAE